ncbi:ELKS/Rab6-interacting/CAST family member 1-like [Esox lucius]|uniref:ELKS/Rab6-interacting/CAST family member 1-like n=1 Tax=Esox lucius TaxID=8010 RepID=UPI0014777FAC|nr:ELKS/Rab6-interacting/CAST family member 1-like [Esox lucius]
MQKEISKLMMEKQLAQQEIDRLKLRQKVIKNQRPRLAWNDKPIETKREEREIKAGLERQGINEKAKQDEETIKALTQEIERLREIKPEMSYKKDEDICNLESERVKLVNKKVQDLERDVERLKEIEQERSFKGERTMHIAKIEDVQLVNKQLNDLKSEVEILKQKQLFQKQRSMHIAESEGVKLFTKQLNDLKREVNNLKEDMTSKEIQYERRFEVAKKAHKRQNERMKQVNQHLLQLEKEVVIIKEAIGLNECTGLERIGDGNRETKNDGREKDIKQSIEKEMEINQEQYELEENFKTIKQQMVEFDKVNNCPKATMQFKGEMIQPNPGRSNGPSHYRIYSSTDTIMTVPYKLLQRGPDFQPLLDS